MDGGCLHKPSFVETILGFGFDALTETFPKEEFNVVSRHIDQPAGCKSDREMLHSADVGFMGFEFADWRFRIGFQKEIRPLPESQTFTPSDNIKEISVSGLKPFSEFLLCFMPVGGGSRLPSQAAIPFPVTHPPEVCPLSWVHSTIVFNGSCHSPSPV